jgi:hypothetical protein
LRDVRIVVLFLDGHTYAFSIRRYTMAPTQVAGGHAHNSAAVTQLLEKNNVFEAISALEHTSAFFLERIEGLAEDCDVMKNAGAGA